MAGKGARKIKNRIRTALLIVILFLVAFYSLSLGQPEKKYPPYPDIWGYEFPWPGIRNRYSAIDVARMSDGDFMVTYVKNWDEKVNKYEGTFFFSGERREFTVSSYNEFWRTHRNNRIGEKKVMLARGGTIEQTSIATSAGCTDPFFDYYLSKKDRNGNIQARKMLLYLYDKPQKLKVNRYCERNNSYRGEYFLKKVENIYVKLVSLEDGTFLAYDTNGNFIIRLDNEFNTKYRLLNGKIFIIERAAYEQIYRRQSEKNKIDDQEMSDIVANYLTDLRKEEAK